MKTKPLLSNVDLMCLKLFHGGAVRQHVLRKLAFAYKHGRNKRRVRDWHRGWYCGYFRSDYAFNEVTRQTSYIPRCRLWDVVKDVDGNMPSGRESTLCLTVEGMKRVADLVAKHGVRKLYGERQFAENEMNRVFRKSNRNPSR